MDTFNQHDHDLENTLGDLRPLAPKLNRDLMLFEAGRASKPSSVVGRILPIVTIAIAFGLIQREMQLVGDRDKIQRLEAKLAALENPVKPTPTVVEVPRRVIVASLALAPSSYGALSQRLRSVDNDDPWDAPATPSETTSTAKKFEDRQTPPLKALDSRRPLSL